MVSQPFMPRTFALPLPLAALPLALLFAGGCGQNEGGRCQVTSDCASGLTCFGESGNGVCRANTPIPTNDAAAGNDAAADLMSTAGPEAQDLASVDVDEAVDVMVAGEDAPEEQASATGPEAAPAAVDVARVDVPPNPAPVDGGEIDVGAVDAGAAE